MKECLFCKTEFEPNKPKQKFCSDKCRVYFNREDISEGGFIYCLRDPLNDNAIFYVGKTIISLDKRLSGHIRESSKKDDKKAEIIKSILESGNDVVIEQLEVISDDSIVAIESKLLEREKYWIKHIGLDGKLANKTFNPALGKKNKTNPIGVRFRIDILEKLKTDHSIDSPQKALVFMERFYVQHHKLAQDITQVLRTDVKDSTKSTSVLKPQEHPKTNFSINTIPEQKEAPMSAQALENAEIEKLIAEIKAEKIPKERDTLIGRRSWQIDQNKRIQKLREQIKNQ